MADVSRNIIYLEGAVTIAHAIKTKIIFRKDSSDYRVISVEKRKIK